MIRLPTKFFLSAAICGLLAGCPPNDCDVHALGLEKVGEGAVDCGHARTGEAEADPVNACAVEAFQADRPFVRSLDRTGFDSLVTITLLSDGSELSLLFRDSAPCGGTNCAPVIDEAQCLGPFVVTSDEGDVVMCVDTGPRERVCN